MADRSNELLSFCQKYGFDELILYDVQKVVPSGADELNQWIEKAKSSYGVSRVAVAGESAGFFKDKVLNVVNGVDWNLEFEFWNCEPGRVLGPYYCQTYQTCTHEEGFDFVSRQLDEMRLAIPDGQRVEHYIGWPKHDTEIPTLASKVDRLLLHIYGREADEKARRSGYRIPDAAQYPDCEVVFIVSAEREFSYSELSSKGLAELEREIAAASPKPVSETVAYYPSSLTQHSLGTWERYNAASAGQRAAADEEDSAGLSTSVIVIVVVAAACLLLCCAVSIIFVAGLAFRRSRAPTAPEKAMAPPAGRSTRSRSRSHTGVTRSRSASASRQIR